MPDQSSRKYLLLAAVAVVVIAGDVYLGWLVPVFEPGHGSGAVNEPYAFHSSAPTVPKQLDVSSVFPVPEFTATTAPTGKIQPAETHLMHSENLANMLTSIESDYHAMAGPILEQSASVIAPEDRNKLTFLDQEKLADLGKVLTTEELEIYQNTVDPTSAPRRR